MVKPFHHLQERVKILGNHHHKYLDRVAKYHKELTDRLEAAGMIDSVHLFQPARDISAEMRIVSQLEGNLSEKLNLLSCYYSLQFLNMNLRALDVLKLDLMSGKSKLQVHKDFMILAGKNFRNLTSSYMYNLLNLFLDDEGRSVEYVICGVGTRADQDDIDVGIIDDGSAGRDAFNQAVGKMSSEMLRNACCLHFHLSEHVSGQRYSASINEYNDMLTSEIHDFVIISEMIGAHPIIGSYRLFEYFKQEITSRYFYRESQDNRYHEGFLRGILGEIQALLQKPMNFNEIHFKDDGLRILKGLASVWKTMLEIQEVNNWEIMAQIRARESSVAVTGMFAKLERALTYLEAFRYLYQLLVVQEEEVYLDDPNSLENLSLVAKYYGYSEVGVVKDWNLLLIHYFEVIRSMRKIALTLLKKVEEYLRQKSVFASLLSEKTIKSDQQLNLPVDFIEKSRFFRGTKYWDDVLAAFEDPKTEILNRFIKDFEKIDSEKRQKVINNYIKTGRYSLGYLIRLLRILALKDSTKGSLFEEFNECFLEIVPSFEDIVVKLVDTFYRYPTEFNDYLMLSPAYSCEVIWEVLKGELHIPELIPVRDNLISLCLFHVNGSHYFKRFFQHVSERYPECFLYTNDPGKLEEMAQGLLGRIPGYTDLDQKKDSLGDYHDVEFLRLGLLTLKGYPIAEINTQFTIFSDNYLQMLFDICKEEVDYEIGHRVRTDDLMAIYVTGGHSREQAFDDDYDIIALLSTQDPEIKKYCMKILSKMNKELVKRGVLPHYRFSDHFGHFITEVNELDGYFTAGGEEVFIDKSQVLGARMVVGSKKFEREFINRIIKPHIYKKYKEYAQDMIREIKSRHETYLPERDGFNIKECPGGLRDIEMILLISKARYGMRKNIGDEFFDMLSRIDKSRRSYFKKLHKALNYLKHVRDLYRLCISSDDLIQKDYLDQVATIMGFTQSGSSASNSTYSPGDALMAEIQRNINDVLKVVEDLMQQAEKDILESEALLR